MTLPADIAHIEKLHQVAEANGDTSFEHHMRAALLRAYRELAGELEAVSKSWDAGHAEVERLTLELQVSTQQAGELRDERDRLRASNLNLLRALRHYGEHEDSCPISIQMESWPHPALHCTCGLGEILADAQHQIKHG